jgi:hypothetical protein
MCYSSSAEPDYQGEPIDGEGTLRSGLPAVCTTSPRTALPPICSGHIDPRIETRYGDTDQEHRDIDQLLAQPARLGDTSRDRTLTLKR